MQVMSRDEWTNNNDATLPSSAICVRPTKTGSIAPGDSGGPLIRQSDEAFIGLASFSFLRRSSDGVFAQGFTNVQIFYAWISYWTGMDLPKCRNQEYVYERIDRW